MPIYEYHCEACNRDFECLVFSGETPCCPKCKGEDVHRLMSACGFMSKSGSGETVSRSAGASACGGCSATNCGSCGH
ncbi:MAG: zinc ribbon domain-containing protein [Desulfobacterales bacterium]|jgi:putative FmdB family regulatory protein|nr:zinc ribbon domain-containing protein [Desulfobacterales bacterium]